MVRGSLGKLASSALSVAGRWQYQQLRRLNIHEYQGAELMGKYGINVPRGAAAGSVQELKDVLKNAFPNEKEIVVKSQILAGGRGLGTFKSGLKGGVHIVNAEEAEGIASKMLGQILVTKQTGPEGKIVSKGEGLDGSHIAPGLADCWEDEFQIEFVQYIKEGKENKMAAAQGLWFDIWKP